MQFNPLHESMRVRGQGTIEYLVLIAVIVVISLVVVALFSDTIGTSVSSISSSSAAAASTSGIISVKDAALDDQGTGVVSLQNLDTSPVTVTQLTIGTTDRNFSNQLFSGDNVAFSLNDIGGACACLPNDTKKTCLITINYLTQEGIPKTEKLSTTVNCVPLITPIDPDKVIGFGSGSLAKPWKITNCQELQNMNRHLDGNYVLDRNIDCTGSVNWNTGAGFSPVGTIGAPFRGSLMGAHHSIAGLTINRPGLVDVGLFGVAQGTHMIARDITLVDANVVGSDFVGAYFGELTGAVGSYTNLSFGGNFVYVWGTSINATIGGGGGAYVGGDFPESFIYNTPDGQPLPLGQVSGDWGSIS